MTKFGINKKDGKIEIFESKTKTVCVPFIKPKYLENVIEGLRKPYVFGYKKEETDSHFILSYKEQMIAKIERRQSTDLVTFLQNISILF